MRLLKIIGLLFIFIGFASAKQLAVQGVLDLRDYDFSQNKFLELDGEWEFYPDTLLNPENFWADPEGLHRIERYEKATVSWSHFEALHQGNKEFGKATYRLSIIFPESFPKQAIAFRDVSTAYEVFVNGKGFEGSGSIGTDSQTSRPYWRNATKTVNFVPGKNEIIVKVSNFHHSQGGILKPVVIGPAEKVFYSKNLEIGGILFLTGCLLLAGIFALGLFWFKTSDTEGVFFFLFCGCFAVFVFSSGPHLLQALFKNLSWETTIRLMYVSLYTSVIFFGYFLLRTFDEILKPTIFHILSGISMLMILATLVLPPAIFTQFLVVYCIIILIALLIIGIGGIEESSFSHKLTLVNMLGMTSLFVVILHQVLIYYNLSAHWPLLEVAGLAIFIFSQALVMAIKFGRGYRESSMAALAAARTREEFLNTMSHELKTPMNAILGMSTFLENTKLSPSQQDKLLAIKENADSLMSMINDVLSISELGSGELKLKESVLDLENSIDSAINLSKQHLKKDSVSFKYYLDPDIPSLLRGDASRIKQVLMHLLNNAFKFTEKGEVLLRVKLLKKEGSKVSIHFSIKDSGVGMQLRARSVLSFFGATKKKSKRLKGTGSRLSITDELLEMMGGKLHIVSKKNVGTEVSFSLQLEEYFKETTTVKSIFRKSEIDPTLKILYAEDNVVNQKLMALMLEKFGLKLDIANNGEEALQMAMKKYYNIILMDIQMPVMDGIEATKRIVENSDARPIIIATTANIASIDKRRCFEVGMNDFLSKPIHQDDLKLAILKWQGLKEYLDASTEVTIKLTS